MLNTFLSGAIMTCYLVAGLFFLRFWQGTRDRLFVMFALAFWLLGVNQVGFVLAAKGSEARSYFYIFRLLAFILILFGIADKNRFGKKEREKK